jgi:5'-nucleotidase
MAKRLFVRRVLIVAGAAVLPLLGGEAHAVPLTLTLLHNNDGESKLREITALDQGPFAGAARFVTLVNEQRDTANALGHAVLTLSSGDNFLAGPEFLASLNDGVFYDARVLSAIDYDAIILGNHDFDFGPGLLADFIGQVDADIPYVSANLDFSASADLNPLVGNRLFASVIVEKDVLDGGGGTVTERFGIVGATTPDLPFISSPGDVVVNQDVVGIVQAEVDALTAQGVNKIVLVTHLQGIANEVNLVSQITGVDIVIAGGGDDLLENPAIPDSSELVPGDTSDGVYPTIVQDAGGNDVPIVTTAGEYKYLGKLVAEFDDAGVLTSIDTGSGPLRVSGISPEFTVPDQDIVDTVVTPVLAGIGALATNIIADNQVTLDGVRNHVRSRETNIGNLVTDAFLFEVSKLVPGLTGPVVAMNNGGGRRNNSLIGPGTQDGAIDSRDLSQLNTFDILPFLNFLAIVPDVTPERLKLLMENAVSRVENRDGRFAQIAGFEIVYDPTAQALVLNLDGSVAVDGARIVSIRLADGTFIVRNGKIVKGAPTVTVATTDFSARGGDQYPFGGLPFTILGVTYQQALQDYITAADGLNGRILTSDARYASVTGEGRITIGQVAVAEPAAVGLLPLALGGLLWARRRVR